ncbi:hypothetical protein [Roseovarius sp.]|uniref:hypothetical protein n=1 Tax=Roseovarius sp. TaxID=1486281 RepID=UPI003A96FF56
MQTYSTETTETRTTKIIYMILQLKEMAGNEPHKCARNEEEDEILMSSLEKFYFRFGGSAKLSEAIDFQKRVLMTHYEQSKTPCELECENGCDFCL